jgi:hypothetical protein
MKTPTEDAEYKISSFGTTSEESQHIRRTSARKIVLFLLQQDRCTFNDILRSTKKYLQLYHILLRLCGLGKVSIRDGNCQTYGLGNNTLVGMLINRIRN